MRVVIADDHAVVRTGMRAVLSGERDVTVVAEAADGAEAVAAVEREKPDVLVMDLTMPRCGGVEAMAQVKKVAPRVRVLVLSMHATPEHVRSALKAGALGYVVKGSGLDHLVKALRVVASGERYLDPSVESLVGGPETVDPLDDLTPRERQVLQLVAEGCTNREVARRLGISPKTADNHRTSLMAKLDLHDAQALTRLAVRRGIVSAE
jgi:DNA-binding NarL/FixJ family response regulator